MSGPGVVLCIVLALFLLGQVRVGCKAAYDENGPQVWVRFGLLHLKVFPIKPKNGRDKGKKPKKEKPEKIKEAVPVTERIGGALGYAEELVPVLLDGVKYFGKKLRVDTLYMRLVAGSSDPADAAKVYGQASAALGALWYPLTQALDVKDGYAKVDLDFDAPKMTLSAVAALSLKISQILWLVVYFGIRALTRFLRERKRQKQEKKLRKAV